MHFQGVRRPSFVLAIVSLSLALATSACGTVKETAESALGAARAKVDEALSDVGLDDLNRDRLQDTVGELRGALEEGLPAGAAESIGLDLEALTDQVDTVADALGNVDDLNELEPDARRAAEDLKERYEEIRVQLEDSDLPDEAKAPLAELDRRILQIIESLEAVDPQS